ncbi:MAG: proprotein convertase P-domain-containing protein [Deltaproteobacteria bacterium]|nr:proprotein convertase P-domain-containing protein [Deltaproteobacteria bacterium]
MLGALALGPACGDDSPVDPTSGNDSTSGDATTTGMSTGSLDSSSTSSDDPTTSGGTTTDDPSSTTSTDPDTTAGETCGNGMLDGDEECDGDELDGQDCEMQGFAGGELGCADDCTFDTSMCVEAGCDNGVIEVGEDCEGKDLGGSDCLSLGFDDGTLSCAADCSFDDSMCEMFSCGNGVIEGTEFCDGLELANQSCITQGLDGGTLVCADNCMGYDISGCFDCGDGVIGGMEQCDGLDLAGQDCTSQGFMFGNLSCDASCNYDISECTNDPTFCSSPGSQIGPDGGTVTMDSVIVPVLGEFVTDVNVYLDAPHTFVGDLLVDIRHVDTDTSRTLVDQACGGTEDVDATFDQDALALPDCMAPIAIEGDVLPEEDLDDYVGMADPAGTWEIVITDQAGGDQGTLDQWCVVFQTSPVDPNVCGDGVRTFGEQCEGADLGGDTCQTQGFSFGDLACTPGCTFDLTDCTDTPTFCSAPASSIGPDPGADTASTIVVPSIGQFVTDVNVTIDATHTSVGDLEIDVRHVDTNSVVRLAEGNCAGGADVLATFDQDAGAVPDCVAPIAIEGPVLPLEDLDAYVGLADSAGEWELTIADTAAGNGGTLNEWCVSFETAAVDPNVCGDGAITFAEDCDGGNLAGQDCEGLGFPQGGMLSCDAACQFDTTGCQGAQCGDGNLAMGEACDDHEIAAMSCEDFGFSGGPLNCEPATCEFDTTDCSNTVTAICSSPMSVIDSALPVTSDTVNVPASGLNVLDVDVFLGITHTFGADLDIVLIHVPTGTTVNLTNDQCGGANDVFAVFNDEAPILPDCIEPVGIEGNVLPLGATLSAFDGELAGGDWTLEITDDAGGDVGTLDEWCVYIEEG